MKILVINAGSSSLKYQLIDAESEVVIAKGNCERIGIDGGIIGHKTGDGRECKLDINMADHKEAFLNLTKLLTEGDCKVIDDMKEISAVGHRIVQGAEKFTSSVECTDEVLAAIEEVSDLAPLHNPAHIQAIKACKEIFDDTVLQAVVFDTAFHQTMPEKAYMFGVPYEYYEKYAIRRYGFHGTSHRYVSAKVAEHLGKDIKDLKIVTCHLGNGSSITAVDGGQSVDTSMGFTPLDGLLMGTRCGGIDPSVITYIMDKEGLTAKEADALMNKQSGFLGISGFTSDNRDLSAAAAEGNKRAKLAMTMQRYQIKKLIGAYAAAMGGLDVVVFTGGIGENAVDVREEVCDGLEFLGIKLNKELNSVSRGADIDISADDARVRTWVIATDEEMTIAKDTMEIYNKK